MLKTQVVALIRDREERRKTQDQTVLDNQQQQQSHSVEQIPSVIGTSSNHLHNIKSYPINYHMFAIPTCFDVDVPVLSIHYPNPNI